MAREHAKNRARGAAIFARARPDPRRAALPREDNRTGERHNDVFARRSGRRDLRDDRRVGEALPNIARGHRGRGRGCAKGHSFSEAVALRESSYLVYAETVTEIVRFRLEAKHFLSLLKDSPEVSVATLTATCAQLHGLVVQIERLKAHTGPQRFADVLLDLTHWKVGPGSVHFPYEKVLIGGWLGRTRMSVTSSSI